MKKAKRLSKAEKVALTTLLMLEEVGLEATPQGLSGLLKGKDEEFAHYAAFPSHGYYRALSKRKLTVMVNGLIKQGYIEENEDEGLFYLALTEKGREETLPTLERRRRERTSPQIRKKENKK